MSPTDRLALSAALDEVAAWKVAVRGVTPFRRDANWSHIVKANGFHRGVTRGGATFTMGYRTLAALHLTHGITPGEIVDVVDGPPWLRNFIQQLTDTSTGAGFIQKKH